MDTMGLKESFDTQRIWYRITFALTEEQVDKLDTGRKVDVKFKGNYFSLQKLP